MTQNVPASIACRASLFQLSSAGDEKKLPMMLRYVQGRVRLSGGVRLTQEVEDLAPFRRVNLV
jgi:hypothetical protein